MLVMEAWSNSDEISDAHEPQKGVTLADTFGTIQIKYVTWDGTKWAAAIQDITRQADFNIIGIQVGFNVIDPDFQHVEVEGQDTDPVRRSDHMDYIANDGSNWSCKIHAHSDGSINFEHWPQGGGSHDDTVINFRTWDGTCLQGTLHNFAPPGDSDSVPVNITFASFPCN